MTSSRRRGELNAKLHMDRQPTVARITDPSLAAGKRREIDNVMKKARASTNEYWDKKLIEVEEKDPNRWRHTGYKKMYIGGGESSSAESDREAASFRYNSSVGGPASGNGNGGPLTSNRYGGVRSRSRSRSRLHKSPPLSPPSLRRRSPHGVGGLDGVGSGGNGGGGGGIGIVLGGRRLSPLPYESSSRGRPRSPPPRGGLAPRSPMDLGRRAGRDLRDGRDVRDVRDVRGDGRELNHLRPRSPPEPTMRRRASRSPINRRRSPLPLRPTSRRGSTPQTNATLPPNKRGQILPRSKRPPSPPPKGSCRSHSNSSATSCTDDSCSVCSPRQRRRSRSHSVPRVRIPTGGPRSPPPKNTRVPVSYRTGGGGVGGGSGGVGGSVLPPSSTGHGSTRIHSARPSSPPPPSRDRSINKYRDRDEKVLRHAAHERNTDVGRSVVEVHGNKVSRSGRHSPPPEDPRLKNRPPEPALPASSNSSTTVAATKKKKKEKELRTRIKIEGEKRSKKHNSSSESDDDSGGSDSDASLPTFTATTRLTLSERFGKMAQWSMDRSNMENMRITKDSAGGALKVMIEEGLESPPRRYSYSPAPAGHFPEELATTAPSGMLSWDDVRVRYDYYKSRGYLRDLDLKDYVKWEEWWYKYQEWLKQERYYEYWEHQQMQRRNRRKKLPITQRLN